VLLNLTGSILKRKKNEKRLIKEWPEIFDRKRLFIFDSLESISEEAGSMR
jgi:hypothetical protein